MRGRLTSGIVAALVLGTLIIGGGLARTAAAFEWDLPGERKFSIHGFYESRLLFVGSELPMNGATWSSLRQVLSTEVELQIFPDGFGPFDSMFMFTRFFVSYECIYTYACGTANSADSYGDDTRRAVRQPLSLKKDAVSRQPFFAGLLPQTYRPGSLAPSQEVLNPGRRYRDCLNPPGVFSNPYPLAVFCNLNNRSPLDSPVNQTGNRFNEVRAGAFSSLTRPSLTAAARPYIGEQEYTRLQNLLINSQVMTLQEDATYRALVVAAGEATDPAVAAALNAQAAALLGTPETTFDANIPLLLATRPDPNRFTILANALAPELTEAQWGSGQLRSLVFPYLATINTPIKPQGYFASAQPLNIIGHYEQALSETLIAQVDGLPFGDPITFTADNATKRANPFFVGPNGVRDDEDDLPFVANNPVAQAAGYTLAPPIAGTDVDRFDNTFGTGSATFPRRQLYTETAQISVQSASNPDDPEAKKVVELYGVYSPDYLISQGCPLVGGRWDRVTGQCIKGGTENVTPQALENGCRGASNAFQNLNIGPNADGDCIELNNSTPAEQNRLQFEVIGLLGDLRVRPGDSTKEPIDATDFRAVADGGVFNTLPARPRGSDGLYFDSPGQRQQYEQYDNLISNLDLKYSVDALTWNHGASQREHEFAEGYLEFEMADSQIYTRVGKLIVVWGKTELFRNQDRNNPLDIGNGIFAPLEEQRVGQWGFDVTFSPEMFMRIGPVEDLRLEVLTLVNPFEPTDLGKCGEGTAIELICLKSFGAVANGMAGIGIIGEHRPYNDYSGIGRWDFGARLEGRLDRFTFALSDFYGWDDAFYLDLVQQYERTSDTETGAPLSVGSRAATTGCKFRTTTVETEEGTEQVPVGPNGIPGDGDDIFPTAGECLLWNPPDANGVQTLRSGDAIAALQNVNQTLFHSLCAYTYDPDEGFCAFDRVNYPLEFGFISNILSGLGVLGGVVLDGTETIRAEPNGLNQRGSDQFKTGMFLALNPLAIQDQANQDLGVVLEPGQAALLACGESYASPCSQLQQAEWGEASIVAALTRDPELGPAKFGGIDLMNADASVVTQEFVGLKALSPGALVGTRLPQNGPLYYQTGINWSRAEQQGLVFNRDGSLNREESEVQPSGETGDYLKLTPDETIALGPVGRAEYQIQPGALVEADGWIEPMPWKINQEALAKFGAIVFETDPENPLDLDSPLNKWNLIDPNRDPNVPLEYTDIDGEYCARWMSFAESDVFTPFNLGCTALETVSANFERLLISLEVIGFDRVFDPPESLSELAVWGQSNTSLQALGDMISGKDGIFTRNQFVFDQEEVDFGVVVFKNTSLRDQSEIVVASADREAARLQLTSYDPEEECQATYCFMQVNALLTDDGDSEVATPLVIDMPISFFVDFADPNEGTKQGNKLNLAKLELEDLFKLKLLLAQQPVVIDGEIYQMSNGQHEQLLGTFEKQSGLGLDLDNDATSDLDRDRDTIWDGQDDFSPGRVTDDNILCGSGVPGDKIQDAAQYDWYRADEAPGSAKFAEVFPDGLPPRSPVFCRGVSGLLSATTQTLPIRKAAGDGTYGRRDFLWQGGRQVSLNYQKRNVLGAGLDFAEDTTKTSWGLEFSWMANKLFPNNTTYSGLSQSDEMVLSVSVDRPTFFNFLNPNRSFFLNLQMFARYLPSYDGSRDDRDGNYATAARPLTGNIVFTFFTGYFQDRLAPRVSILYAPWESQGAVITGLSYRWNDAFSTSIGYTQFFGHIYDQQGAYFPIAQYGSVADYDGAVLRGVAPVLYRDQAELRIRYTW